MTDHNEREALIARLRMQIERANSTMERIADQGSIEDGNSWAIDEHQEAYELAEVGRLAIAALEASRPSPAPVVTDEMVERAAKAIYATVRGIPVDALGNDWDPIRGRTQYRVEARAALSAALTPEAGQ